MVNQKISNDKKKTVKKSVSNTRKTKKSKSKKSKSKKTESKKTESLLPPGGLLSLADSSYINYIKEITNRNNKNVPNDSYDSPNDDGIIVEERYTLQPLQPVYDKTTNTYLDRDPVTGRFTRPITPSEAPTRDITYITPEKRGGVAPSFITTSSRHNYEDLLSIIIDGINDCFIEKYDLVTAQNLNSDICVELNQLLQQHSNSLINLSENEKQQLYDTCREHLATIMAATRNIMMNSFNPMAVGIMYVNVVTKILDEISVKIGRSPIISGGKQKRKTRKNKSRHH